tara:strand:+ start:537 stop:821 length:285 start_codon:yes stop_codon:yes gene_type:complete
MASTDFLKVMTIVYENDDLDDIIGNTNSKTYKRLVVVPYANIFILQEGLDKRQSEIHLIDGDVIIALENITVLEELWHLWYTKQHSLDFYTKSN